MVGDPKNDHLKSRGAMLGPSYLAELVGSSPQRKNTLVADAAAVGSQYPLTTFTQQPEREMTIVKMTKTQKKLDEAKYFLNMLQVTDPYFDYMLSAYLNAARSTLWVMRHEFVNVAGWEEWFRSGEATKEERSLLSETNQMRIDSAKKGEMNTEFFLFGDDTVVISEASYSEVKQMLEDLEGKEFELTIRVKDDHAREPAPMDAFVLQAYVKPQPERSPDPRPDIKRKCSAYLGFLNHVVHQCHQKFGNGNVQGDG